MKRSELKESIKNEITSVLLEGMSDEERENRIQHLMRTGAKEKPLRKLAAIGKKEDEKDLKEASQYTREIGLKIIELIRSSGVAPSDIMNTLEKEFDMDAPLNEEKEEDDDDKAASKSAKKEKLGKQASKLSKEDEDRYDRIKNGLEKLKKKGDEESMKKMKAILSKKDVEKLIKSKGRTKASFM